MAEKIKLITVCSHPEHATNLIRSAEKHGWDLEVIKAEWKGFGTKIIETYDYLRANPEVDRFVFADAFDVVVFGTPEEFLSKIYVNHKILVSAERGLWPPSIIPYRDCYDRYPQRFDYINSGLYYARSEEFIRLVDTFPPFYEIDDQMWLNIAYLVDKGSETIKIDNFQTVFNSHSFIDAGEYGYENGRVQILGGNPVFVHSNSKTEDPKLDELVKEMLS